MKSIFFTFFLLFFLLTTDVLSQDNAQRSREYATLTVFYNADKGTLVGDPYYVSSETAGSLRNDKGEKFSTFTQVLNFLDGYGWAIEHMNSFKGEFKNLNTSYDKIIIVLSKPLK